MDSKVKSKKKEKHKEEKMDISLKDLSSEAKKSKEESDNSDEEAPKEEKMGLFVRRYNRYMKRNKLKHSDKGLVNFKKSHPPKREHKQKDKKITCYECIKLGNYRTTCPSLTKHHKKKDKEFYKMKGKTPKIVKPILYGKKRMRAPP